MRAVILAALAAFAACDEPLQPAEKPAPRITIQRQNVELDCYANLSGQAALEPMVAAHLVPGSCAATEPALIAGGVDRLRVVLDYGAVAFAANSLPPTPMVNLFLDGIQTTVPITIEPVRLAGDRAYVLATFVAPTQRVADARVFAQVMPEYATTSSPFEVSAATIQVDTDNCEDDVPCEALSGMGTVTVNFTLPVSGPVSATAAHIVDGVTQQLGVQQVMTGPPVDGRVRGTLFVTPPVARDRALWVVRIDAGGAIGFSEQITLRTPPVEVSVQGCTADESCRGTSGVGSAAVDISVDATAPVTGMLSSYLDGVLQPGSLMVTTNVVFVDGEAKSIGTQFVPVPLAAPGTVWTIEAVVGTRRSLSPPIVLEAPAVTAVLSCVAPCDLQPGSTVGLALTAPLEIREHQASVATAVNGVPNLTSTVTLDILDRVIMTRSRVIMLTVPDEPGATWTIDVVVAGFQADTIVATIATEDVEILPAP